MQLSILNRCRSEKGATLVEGAVSLSLFLMLTLGSIDLSWLLYQKIALHFAARFGANAGAVSADPSCARRAQIAKTEAANFLRGISLLYDDTTTKINPVNSTPTKVAVTIHSDPHCFFLCHLWFGATTTETLLSAKTEMLAEHGCS